MNPTLRFSRLGAFSLFLVLSGTSVFSAPLASVPRYENPGAGQVFYFVLTDRFENGDSSNDTGGYGADPSVSGFDPTRVSHYHGGDFKGLTAKLDYIQGLGTTAIWVTPPFVNKPMQEGTAGYHGYWILDFLKIDPHLGTDEDFRAFVRAAHARGIKVYLDIVVNHTADVIGYRDGSTAYIDHAHAPYRDASGRPFKAEDFAYNGVKDLPFPVLSAETSFPHVPIVPQNEAHAKNPDWLNDVTHYHNRGNSAFKGESSTEGDFVGLDDLFTEQQSVVDGFISVYSHWLVAYDIDGYRIDTVKHVNREFWQAFGTAIHEAALSQGKPGFFMFGEVSNSTGDEPLMSAFCDTGTLDASLDFGFFGSVQAYVAEKKPASLLYDLFSADDYYTGPDRSAYGLPTFISNHDAGRFGYFLRLADPKATPAQLLALESFADGLLYLCRGQPVAYYGDEQGMTGYGNDMGAREDMFASRSEKFQELALLGTQRTGRDDKFDPTHPLYRLEAALASLRRSVPALAKGAMVLRPVAGQDVFAFSRIDRDDQVEYLVAFNRSRTVPATISIPTSQPGGAGLSAVFDSREANPSVPEHVVASKDGTVTAELAPLGFKVWRADHRLSRDIAPPTVELLSPAAGATVAVTERDIDGQRLPNRVEIRAEVKGGDGVAEVTFTMARASRPRQLELLGTADRPPYRVFWKQPADLARNESLTFIATVDDLRGHRSSAEVAHVTAAEGPGPFGISGATVPFLASVPPDTTAVAAGAPLRLEVAATGTPPLHYQWYHNGRPLQGATSPSWTGTAGPWAEGSFFARVSNREGTTLSLESTVHVDTTPTVSVGRIESQPSFHSAYVPARQIDVWVPPSYDANRTERYPVIYLQDGQNLFDPKLSYMGQSWEVQNALAGLVRDGKAPEAILVGIWNAGVRRPSEFIPAQGLSTPWVDEVPNSLSTAHLPIQSQAYLSFIVKELKPWVDRTYRTKPDFTHTFIMGSSMGGLISAYAVCQYPDVFGGAGCMSTHWTAGDGALIPYLVAHLPDPSTHKLYFDLGDRTLDSGYGLYQRQVDLGLQEHGFKANLSWETKRFPGDEHAEPFWRRRVAIPLRFLLQGLD